MATHSSIRAWEIPWTEEAGGLQSIVSQRDASEKLQVRRQSFRKYRISHCC